MTNRSIMILVIFFVLFLLPILWPMFGYTYLSGPLSEIVDNPRLEGANCGYKDSDSLTSNICDPNFLLSIKGFSTINTVLRDLDQLNKGQVAFVVTTHKQTWSIKTEDAATNAAKELIDQWGIGRSGINDGVVMVIAIDDRKMGMYAGSGVRDLLPNSVIERIFKRMQPFLRTERLDDALIGASMDLRDVLNGSPLKGEAHESTQTWGQFVLQHLFWIVIFPLFCLYHAVHEWYVNRKKKKVCEALDRVDRAKAKKNARDFDQETCVICLGEFTKPIALLPCGHKLCQKTCAMPWFGENNLKVVDGVTYTISKNNRNNKSRVQCPLCRKDTRRSYRKPTNYQDNDITSRNNNNNNIRQGLDDDIYREQLFFIHRQHPSYFTMKDAQKMCTNHRTPSFKSSRAIWTSTYDAREQATRASSSSGSDDWGGGSSTGGGGCGGSW